MEYYPGSVARLVLSLSQARIEAESELGPTALRSNPWTTRFRRCFIGAASRRTAAMFEARNDMDDTNALIKQRMEKLDALRRAKGIDPFKNKFTPTEKCAEARANYVEGREVGVAGRATAHRDMGKSMFIDVRDQ